MFQPREQRFSRPVTSTARAGNLPGEAGQEDVRRVVGAQLPVQRVAGFWTPAVDPFHALCALCAVVVQPE